MSPFFSFPATLATSLLGTQITYWCIHQRRFNPIRAASLSSLLFVGLANLSGSPAMLSLQAAYFGSTYVAMTDPARLSRRKVLIAAFIFALILFTLQTTDFVHYRGGVGGTLGGAAFMASLSVYAAKSIAVRRAG